MINMESTSFSIFNKPSSRFLYVPNYMFLPIIVFCMYRIPSWVIQTVNNTNNQDKFPAMTHFRGLMHLGYWYCFHYSLIKKETETYVLVLPFRLTSPKSYVLSILLWLVIIPIPSIHGTWWFQMDHVHIFLKFGWPSPFQSYLTWCIMCHEI